MLAKIFIHINLLLSRCTRCPPLF